MLIQPGFGLWAWWVYRLSAHRERDGWVLGLVSSTRQAGTDGFDPPSGLGEFELAAKEPTHQVVIGQMVRKTKIVNDRARKL
jgi:hypothetical protein